jgi:hypothetical protein
MTESKQQQLVITWFKLQYPGKIIFAIPNGAMLGGRNPKQMGSLRKREGLLKGVSDLFIPIPSFSYSGLFIEMKNIGKTLCSVSEDQRWFIDEMREAGFVAEWCAGFDAAKEVITEYMKGR